LTKAYWLPSKAAVWLYGGAKTPVGSSAPAAPTAAQPFTAQVTGAVPWQEGLSKDGLFIAMVPPQLTTAEAKNKTAVLAITLDRICIVSFLRLGNTQRENPRALDEHTQYLLQSQDQTILNAANDVLTSRKKAWSRTK
jgi:hypothetical protein